MVKSSLEIKNSIINYIEVTGGKWRESTKDIIGKNPELDWQILAGHALHITKMKNREDRIQIHYTMSFPGDVVQNLVIGTPLIEKMLNVINGMLIFSNLSNEWHIKNGLITGMSVKTHLDEEELTRPAFHKIWDSVVYKGNHVAKKLIISVMPEHKIISEIGDTESFIVGTY